MSHTILKRNISVVAALAFWTVLPAYAACNNLKNWLEAPGSETKFFIDEESKV